MRGAILTAHYSARVCRRETRQGAWRRSLVSEGNGGKAHRLRVVSDYDGGQCVQADEGDDGDDGP